MSARLLGSLPGPSQRGNQGAADCSADGMLALGAGACIPIIDLASMQVLCTLAGGHASLVTCIKWEPPHPSGPGAPAAVQEADGVQGNGRRRGGGWKGCSRALASGDRSGRVIIWDLPTASPLKIIMPHDYLQPASAFTAGHGFPLPHQQHSSSQPPLPSSSPLSPSVILSRAANTMPSAVVPAIAGFAANAAGGLISSAGLTAPWSRGGQDKDVSSSGGQGAQGPGSLQGAVPAGGTAGSASLGGSVAAAGGAQGLTPTASMRTVRGLEWLQRPGADGDAAHLLAACYKGGSVALYDSASATGLWKSDLGEEAGGLLHVSNGRLGYLGVYCTRAEAPLTLVSLATLAGGAPEVKQLAMPAGIGGGASSTALAVCHPPRSEALYFLFQREIVALDLGKLWRGGAAQGAVASAEVNSPLTTTPLPRGTSPFAFLCVAQRQRLFLAVHTDATVSVWLAGRHSSSGLKLLQTANVFPSFDKGKGTPAVMSACAFEPSPVLSSSIVQLLCTSDDGRVWQWDLAPKLESPRQRWPGDMRDLLDLLEPDVQVTMSPAIQQGQPPASGGTPQKQPASAVAAAAAAAAAAAGAAAAAAGGATTGGMDLAPLWLTGMAHMLSSPGTYLAAPCSFALPAAAVRGAGSERGPIGTPRAGERELFSRVVAVGTRAGTVELVDISGAMPRVAACFMVHGGGGSSASPVYELQWLGPWRLVSCSFSGAKSAEGQFYNYLALVDLQTGHIQPFRVKSTPEKGHIHGLKVSATGGYAILLFRNLPSEVWHLDTASGKPELVRTLNLPFAVLEWQQPAVAAGEGGGGLLPATPYGVEATPIGASAVRRGNSAVRWDITDRHDEPEPEERFAFALMDGGIGVFALQGKRMRDAKPVPPASFGSGEQVLTAMAFRSNLVLMGDMSGNLQCWDVKNGQWSTFVLGKSGVKGVCFAPFALPTGSLSRGFATVRFASGDFAVFNLDTGDIVCGPLGRHIGSPAVDVRWLFRANAQPVEPADAGACDGHMVALGSDGCLRLVETRGIAARLLPLYRNAGSFSAASTDDLALFVADDDDDEALDREPTADLLQMDSADVSATAGAPSTLAVELLAQAAALAGQQDEADFWAQLPRAVRRGQALVSESSAAALATAVAAATATASSVMEASVHLMDVTEDGVGSGGEPQPPAQQQAREQHGSNRVLLPTQLTREDMERWVHAMVVRRDYESAVMLLLSTPPSDAGFLLDALRAVALAASVSTEFRDHAVRMAAANLAAGADGVASGGADGQLVAAQLLCSVERYHEACAQLQDAGRWEDAQALAASSRLPAGDQSRLLLRWAAQLRRFAPWRAALLMLAAGMPLEEVVTLPPTKVVAVLEAVANWT